MFGKQNVVEFYTFILTYFKLIVLYVINFDIQKRIVIYVETILQ